MTTDHARLSPSASARWLRCTASVRAIEVAAPVESISAAAEEGTAAHALAALVLAECVNGDESLDDVELMPAYAQWLTEFSPADPAEMLAHARTYAQYVAARLAGAGPGTVLYVERRLDTGLRECYGTADAVIVTPTSIEVIDYKYGRGVVVEVTGNPQLSIYGLGALFEFDSLIGSVETVRLTIVQPRAGGEVVRSWGTTAASLRDWSAITLEPAVRAALDGEGTAYAPSQDSCRWCPLAGSCRVRAASVLVHDFDTPIELSPDELGAALHVVPQLRSWADSLEREAFAAIYHRGSKVPGWKVVQRGGRRVVVDADALLTRLAEAGIDNAAEIKPRGFGVLDRLAGGKDQLERIAGDALGRSTPPPSLVPESVAGEPVTSVCELDGY